MFYIIEFRTTHSLTSPEELVTNYKNTSFSAGF